MALDYGTTFFHEGGTSFGETDDFGYCFVDNPVHVHDVHAMIFYLTGIDHHEPNSRSIGHWTKHHVTVRGKKDVNPIKATTENIAKGKQLFGSECMVCHGLDAQNTGVPFAKTISPPIPSLASEEVQAYTDGQIKWIIENGLYPSGMPPSKGDISNEEMWQMVVYIRNLPKAGSLGDPPVYGGSGK